MSSNNSRSRRRVDEFVDEVIHLMETAPDATENQVERGRFLRYGEAGDYEKVVATVNAADPHGN